MSKYNTDCFSHNVLLDLLHLQRQLCISQPFGTWFLYSKKSPLFTFYGAFWSKIGDLNSHPQFGKLMCWPLTLILHIKVGSQALPVPYLTWFFWRDGFTTNSPLVFTAAFTQVYERDYLVFTSTNADFRFIQILHVPLYFIGQKFSHEQIQHGLLFT